MPGPHPFIFKIAGQEIYPGKVYDFGTISVSEDEIISFALFADPLPIHMDREAGRKSPFGKIIGSGPQLFIEFHKRNWIPIFGESVLAGLAIRNWEFLKPHFPDEKILGQLEVVKVEPKQEKKCAVIFWRYTFRNEAGELIQAADFEVMHKLEGN